MMDSSPGSEVNPWWRRVVIGRRPVVTVIRGAALVVCSLILFKFWLLPFWISGVSMEPTYRNGHFNFINALSYLRAAPRRGDVVAIEMTGRGIMYLKRIIALPGESIAIRGGIVYVNGEPLNEPYVTDRSDWNMTEVVLGPETFFVIGDNRATDQSRHRHGEVGRSKIVGKVLF